MDFTNRSGVVTVATGAARLVGRPSSSHPKTDATRGMTKVRTNDFEDTQVLTKATIDPATFLKAS
jgi:hypothetical protein